MYTLVGKSRDSPGVSPTLLYGRLDMYTRMGVPGLSWDIPNFVIWMLGHVHSSREVPGLSWDIPNFMIWMLGYVHSSREVPGLSWDILDYVIWTLGHVHSNRSPRTLLEYSQPYDLDAWTCIF